ncbi:MAG: hypothetical protein ATN35_02630 [Epulopiscium sp. Nele67-Bin004]|nr:MAG: hypothetical protein ATN35_02630 [Epulopiscium sp. Nele67-Bin004]
MRNKKLLMIGLVVVLAGCSSENPPQVVEVDSSEVALLENKVEEIEPEIEEVVEEEIEPEIEEVVEEIEPEIEEVVEEIEPEIEEVIAEAVYMVPESNSKYLTADDISHLSAAELRIARNEIFARHGRMFASADLQTYFTSQSWYNGTVSADSFSESVLNDMEKANVTFISNYESGSTSTITPEKAMELVKAYSSHNEFSYGGIKQSLYGVYGQEAPWFHVITPVNFMGDGLYAVHVDSGKIYEGSSVPDLILYDGFPILSESKIYEISNKIYGSGTAVSSFTFQEQGRTFYHMFAHGVTTIIRDDGVLFDGYTYDMYNYLEPVMN